MLDYDITMKADKILVLENGAIKEQGSHDELMKIQGLYYRFVYNTGEKV